MTDVRRAGRDRGCHRGAPAGRKAGGGGRPEVGGGTASLEAYELFLQGRWLLWLRGNYILQAIDRFEGAPRSMRTMPRPWPCWPMPSV
jgi:hypothetical protein